LELAEPSGTVHHKDIPAELRGDVLRIAEADGLLSPEINSAYRSFAAESILKHDAYRCVVCYWLTDAGKVALARWRASRGRPRPATEHASDDDGLPINWDREFLEKQNIVRRLLKYMLGREEATLSDVAQEVWGGEVPDGRIKTYTSRANGFLISQAYPRVLKRRRGKGMLRWAPA
jgi:hypothetical protein